MQDLKQTILVVEDDDGIRTLIATILRLSGYDVIAFADGDEALEKLRERSQTVHLLITDIDLGPFMDGLELAQGLRTLFPSVQVLYITGLSDRQEMLLEINQGQAGFLSKPFKPSTLTGKVHAMLNQTKAAKGKAKSQH
jgi:DNA-binding response OmpR family regulator